MDSKQNSTPQNDPTSVPPASFPVPQKQQSTIRWFVLILLFLLLSTTVFLGYQNWQLKQQISSGKPTPIPSLAVTPTPDPTAEWKTYTIANYSFKYPPYLQVHESTVSSLHTLFDSAKYPGLSLRVVLDGAGIGFQCVESIYEKEEDIGSRIVKKEVLMGLSMSTPMCGQDTSDEYTIIITLNPKEKLNDDVIFSFTTNVISLNEASSILDQILSTFRFD